MEKLKQFISSDAVELEKNNDVNNEILGKNTIKFSPEEGRDLKTYEDFLGFKKENLEGKVVLDLGSGERLEFSRGLKKAGVNATVISLSPDYDNEEQRKLLKPGIWDKFKSRIAGKENNDLIVAGYAEELPFKDDSFDEVLASFSVSTWSVSNYMIWLPEIHRVLKKGGTGRIGPFRDPKFDIYDGDILYKERDKMMNFFDEFGCKYEFVPGNISRQSLLIIHKDSE